MVLFDMNHDVSRYSTLVIAYCKYVLQNFPSIYKYINFVAGRSWLFFALNDTELESYLQSFSMNTSEMLKHYHRYVLDTINKNGEVYLIVMIIPIKN